MIGKILVLGVLIASAVISIYKAGKYANGGVEISKGPSSAAASGISAFISIVLAILLYLNI